MKIKQLIVLLMAAVVLLSACSQSKTATQAPTATPTAEATQAAAVKPDPNKTYDYEVREIWTENNGNRIYGEAYIPNTGVDRR